MSKFTDIQTKIERLLAKAESTTPEEAEALLEAAAKLMARHGVTEAMLQSAGKSTKEAIVQKTVAIKSRYGRELMLMAFAVSRAHGSVRMSYLKFTNRDFVVTFYGHESDTEMMVMLTNSLIAQAETAVAAWWKTHKLEHSWRTGFQQFVQRREFVSGFGRGAAEKLRGAMKEAIEESDETSESGTSTALVLRSRSQAVDEYVEQNVRLGKGRTMRTQSGSYDAAAAGRAAGRNANVSRTKSIRA